MVAQLESLYLERELASLNPNRIPAHVAIIMDGNRRWAKNKGFPPLVGHWRGAESLTQIVRAASNLGIKHLTVFSFSTENWNRSPIEVAVLMRLLKSYLRRKRSAMVEEGVRLTAIGDTSRLPEDVRLVLKETIQSTAHCNTIELTLAVSYGSRDEMRRAILAIADDCVQGKLSKEELSEERISSYLDTAGRPDPELLIRTSGESRLSNFLLWQVSYSEMVISKVLWPDFGPSDLLEAILEYQRRELRRGL